MHKTKLSTVVAALIVGLSMPINAASSGTLDQRVERLERMLENPVLLQLSRRLGDQQREIQNLQDDNDRLKRKVAQLTDLINRRYAETDERLSVLEGKTVSKLTGDLPAVIPESQIANEVSAVSGDSSIDVDNEANIEADVIEKAAAVTKVSQSEQPKSVTKEVTTRPATNAEKESYKAAFALMREAKYSESIAAFEAFQQANPESSLSSNAAYWAGEGYLVKDQAEKALAAFLQVIEVYPDSPKIPDATLRAGDSYANLGQNDKAVEMYKKIIAERPLSKAAKNAKKRLDAK